MPVVVRKTSLDGFVGIYQGCEVMDTTPEEAARRVNVMLLGGGDNTKGALTAHTSDSNTRPETHFRIALLGPIASGKTCLTVGMYGVMHSSTIGFRLYTPELDDIVHWLLLWNQMNLHDPHKDRWPPPTFPGVYPYRFSLESDSGFIGSFDLADHSGELLHRLDTVVYQDDLNRLLEFCSRSSCLALCVPGDAVAQSPVTVESAARVGSYRLIELSRLLAQTIAASHKRPLPIAIVITKYDLCLVRKRKEQDLIRDIKSMFAPLFERGSGFLVAVCPVTLGVSLAKDPKAGALQPLHVHWPIMFAMWATLRSSLDDGRLARRDTQPGIPKLTDIVNTRKLLAAQLKGMHVFLEGQEIDVTRY